MITRYLLALVVSCFAIPACADAVRTDIPIQLDIKPGSKLNWWISVRYGSTTLPSLLDTGSNPTQVLPGQLQPGDAQDTGQPYSITYGGARAYSGTIYSGVVTMGAASVTTNFGIPNNVHCTAANPNCPVQNGDPRTAVFGGSYNAIVGGKVGAGRPPDVFYTLSPRFVITAPRNGENNNLGDLLLNPTVADTNGFSPLVPFDPSYGAPQSTVYGCLRNLSTGYHFCGGIVPDTGVTGILVFPANQTNGPGFNSGDSARIEFTDAYYARIAGVDFTVGQNVAANVTYMPPGQYALPVIKVGQMPYLGFRILTDLNQSTIAVSPRPASPGGIFGHVP